jgi:hypothetical protein
MATRTELSVALLESAASRDARLVEELTRLINDVYGFAERGLWRDGFTRTSPAEIAELIAAREIAVATGRDRQVVGSIRIHQAPCRARRDRDCGRGSASRGVPPLPRDCHRILRPLPAIRR